MSSATVQERRWIVLITDHILPPADIEQEAFAEAEFRFLLHSQGPEASAQALRQADAILTWHLPIDPQTVRLLDSCRIVVRYGVGFDTVDVDALAARGIPLCNTPDYGTEEVADTACAMILGIQRKTVQYDRACRGFAAGWQENLLKPHVRTCHQAVGLIGVGRIGTAVVNRLKPFRCRILGYDPYQPSGHEKAVGYERVETLEQLLEISDIVTVHCPLTDQTRGMIDRAFLDRMKPGACLVNTARGAILANLDCLEQALRSGRLSCAALDVLPSEPPEDHPLLRAWRADASWIAGRLVINPHAAYYSEDGWHEMRSKAARTVRMYLQTGALRNHVPPTDVNWRPRGHDRSLP